MERQILISTTAVLHGVVILGQGAICGPSAVDEDVRWGKLGGGGGGRVGGRSACAH